jgi:hypothetical protein
MDSIHLFLPFFLFLFLFFLSFLKRRYKMASYHTVPGSDASPTFQPKASRSFLASVMLGICIVSFVLQTELAQYVQKNTNFSKPYFIL